MELSSIESNAKAGSGSGGGGGHGGDHERESRSAIELLVDVVQLQKDVSRPICYFLAK